MAIFPAPPSRPALPESFVEIETLYESRLEGLVIDISPVAPYVAARPTITRTLSPAPIPVVELSVILIEPDAPETTATPSLITSAEDDKSLLIYGPPVDTARSTSV